MVAALTPSTAPAAPLARPRVVMIGTAFAATGLLVFFASVLGIYLFERSAALTGGKLWIPDGVIIPLSQPDTMLFTLLMSSVTVQWAVEAIRRDNRRHAYLAFGITALFGVAFLNMEAYLDSILDLDVSIANVMPVLYYTITGAHAAMVVAAMILLGLMAFRALGGQYTSRQHDGVSAAALFWHTMVVVYAIVWYAIYVTK
jgi:heme/copper-type cytochrome/quinol oxidase subunit 3